MINLTREEAQQVLGVLSAITPEERKVIAMLLTKLSAPEPEPVATQYKYIDAFGNDYWTDEPWEGKKVEAERYLYTTPPQREWVGLTDEEILKLFGVNGTADSDRNALAVLKDAHKLLEAIKEKNNG
jgi:hypothetical protein